MKRHSRDGDIRTLAWILLCVSEEGRTVREISEIADGINHAVPTERELQTSLRRLSGRALIVKAGRRFALAPAGAAILARARSPERPILQAWHEAELELERLFGDGR